MGQAHCHLSRLQSHGVLAPGTACQFSEPWEEGWRLLMFISALLCRAGGLSLPVGLCVNSEPLFTRYKAQESVLSAFHGGWYEVQSSSSSFSRPSLCQKSVSPCRYLVRQTCIPIRRWTVQYSTTQIKHLLLLKSWKHSPTRHCPWHSSHHHRVLGQWGVQLYLNYQWSFTQFLGLLQL